MTIPERVNAQAKKQSLQMADVLRSAYKGRLTPQQRNELVRFLPSEKAVDISPATPAGAVEVAAMTLCPELFSKQKIFLSKRGIRVTSRRGP